MRLRANPIKGLHGVSSILYDYATEKKLGTLSI